MNYALTVFFILVILGDLYIILKRRKFIEKYRRRALLIGIAIMAIALLQLVELWSK